jgi:hypothetical protein
MRQFGLCFAVPVALLCTELLQVVDGYIEEVSRPLREHVAAIKLLLVRASLGLCGLVFM